MNKILFITLVKREKHISIVMNVPLKTDDEKKVRTQKHERTVRSVFALFPDRLPAAFRARIRKCSCTQTALHEMARTEE